MDLTPHLTPHLIRVTGAVCRIWIDLGRGVRARLGFALRLRPWLWDWRPKDAQLLTMASVKVSVNPQNMVTLIWQVYGLCGFVLKNSRDRPHIFL